MKYATNTNLPKGCKKKCFLGVTVAQIICAAYILLRPFIKDGEISQSRILGLF